MPKPVERIRTPTPAVFFNEYVKPSRPVILTDLFRGQPIRKLSSASTANAALGDMPVQIRQEYTSVAFDVLSQAILAYPEEVASGQDKRRLVFQNSTFSDYLALVAAEPKTKLLCPENPLSEKMRGLFELPTSLFCRQDPTGANDEVRAFMFIGNAGNVSAMHFDGDIAELLHYQVFGRKRHILAEPRVARKLMPIDHFSTVLLGNFSDGDKQRFIDYVDAYDCVLEPGETLFMPAQYWHHVEYVETAFSFNMRFGRNAYTRFLHTAMHRDMYRQNIAAKWLDPATVEKEYFDYWNSLKAACTAGYQSPREKYRTIKTLLKKIYAEICQDAIQADYSTAVLHEAIEEKLVVDLAKFYQKNFEGTFEGNSAHRAFFASLGPLPSMA